MTCEFSQEFLKHTTTATSTPVHLDTGCYTPVHPDTGRYTLVHADKIAYVGSSPCEYNNPTCPMSDQILVHLLSLSTLWWSQLAPMPRYEIAKIRENVPKDYNCQRHIGTSRYGRLHTGTCRYGTLHGKLTVWVQQSNLPSKWSYLSPSPFPFDTLMAVVGYNATLRDSHDTLERTKSYNCHRHTGTSWYGTLHTGTSQYGTLHSGTSRCATLLPGTCWYNSLRGKLTVWVYQSNLPSELSHLSPSPFPFDTLVVAVGSDATLRYSHDMRERT